VSEVPYGSGGASSSLMTPEMDALAEHGMLDRDARTALHGMQAKLAALGKTLDDFRGQDSRELVLVFGPTAGRAAVIFTR
jgi:hypothetical protein